MVILLVTDTEAASDKFIELYYPDPDITYLKVFGGYERNYYKNKEIDKVILFNPKYQYNLLKHYIKRFHDTNCFNVQFIVIHEIRPEIFDYFCKYELDIKYPEKEMNKILCELLN